MYITTGAVCAMLDGGVTSPEHFSLLHKYPPPELLRTSKHVRQSDIWSVGCCLLEMLTAQEVSIYVSCCMLWYAYVSCFIMWYVYFTPPLLLYAFLAIYPCVILHHVSTYVSSRGSYPSMCHVVGCIFNCSRRYLSMFHVVVCMFNYSFCCCMCTLLKALEVHFVFDSSLSS